MIDLEAMKSKSSAFYQQAHVLELELRKNGSGNKDLITSLLNTLRLQVEEFRLHKPEEFPIPEQQEAADFQSRASQRLVRLEQMLAL
jgi:hypothetical protein